MHKARNCIKKLYYIFKNSYFEHVKKPFSLPCYVFLANLRLVSALLSSRSQEEEV